MRALYYSLTKRIALLTSFGALVLLLVIGLALVSFSQYKETLNDVAEHRVQALLTATRLVQQAEGMVNASAMLLLAEDHFTRRQAVFELGDRQEWISRLIEQLQYYQKDSIDLNALENAQTALVDNLNTVNRLVRQRIALHEEVKAQETASPAVIKRLEAITAEITEVIRINRDVSRELTMMVGQQVSQIRATILNEVNVLNEEMASRQTLLFYLGGLALLTVLLVVIYINHSVVGRVIRLQQVLSRERVQPMHVPVEGRDEIAWMAKSIRRYVEKINNNETRILEMNDELSFLASHDALTKLYNRHYLDRKIHEMNKAENIGPLSAAMLDIDHFKNVNDTYGHDVGDQVICQFAQHLQAVLPATALLARVGGEEFAVIFQRLDMENVASILEQCRIQIAETLFVAGEQRLRVTTSIGLAGYCDCDDLAACLKQADQALYQAKRQGRNQLVKETYGC